MTTVEGQDHAAALDEVLAQHGSVHVFSRGTVSTRPFHLKYLWVFPAVVIVLASCVTPLFLTMKDTSGLLKPVFERMEGSVKRTMDRPLFQRVNRSKFPVKILVFFDRQVDYVVQMLYGVLPGTVKEVCYEVLDVSRSAVTDFQRYGVHATAKGYFDKYEPMAKSCAIWANQKVLRLPLVPQAVACIRYAAVMVNRIIVSFKESGLPLVSFLPLLPVNCFDEGTRSE